MLRKKQPRRQTGAQTRVQPRGQRGLDDAALLQGALGEMERAGVEDFSLRAAARAIGCDPAALIYHFGSREGLERAVADRLHAKIVRLDPALPWRERLLGIARQYRTLARDYPRTFPILMRYWTTGPRDLAIADDTFRALADAGVPDDKLPATECGLYAALLGLCAAEAGGLVGRPGPETMKEIGEQPELEAMRRLLPQIRRLETDQIFEATLGVMLDGIEALGRRASKKAPLPEKRGRAPRKES